MENRKDKILFILQLPPPIHGASLMNQYLIDSTLVRETFVTDHISLQYASTIRDITSITIGKLLKVVKYFFLIIKKVVAFRPNLVYFTISPVGGAFYRDAFFVMLLSLMRCKIVYHLHGRGIIENYGKSKLNKVIYHFVFDQRQIIHLSDMLMYDIAFLKYKKCYIVPNGIPNDNTIMKREAYLLDKGNSYTIKLLYLSNLNTTKGILTFLEAIKLLKDRGVAYEAKIVGSEGDVTIEYIDQFVKENDLETVSVLGPKYGQEKSEILKTSDILVFPTFLDCFPLVILEALQNGLAIVTTDNGAIADMVSHNVNGLILKNNEGEELSDNLEYLIKNRNIIQEMREANQKKFIEKYTIDKFESNMVNTLGACLLN